MGSSLYRAILRQVDVQFARQGLPLTGVVGMRLSPPCLAPLQAIADAVRGGHHAEGAAAAPLCCARLQPVQHASHASLLVVS